jgi:hypothetical protein
MGIRREEEMEMSDDDSDESPCKKIRREDNGRSDTGPIPNLLLGSRP